MVSCQPGSTRYVVARRDSTMAGPSIAVARCKVCVVAVDRPSRPRPSCPTKWHSPHRRRSLRRAERSASAGFPLNAIASLLDELTHADRVDPDARFRRLAALAEALAVARRELLDQLEHVAASRAARGRDDRRLHALVAVAHVELERVPDVGGLQALAQQVFAALRGSSSSTMPLNAS